MPAVSALAPTPTPSKDSLAPQMKTRNVGVMHFKALDDTQGIAEMIVNVFNTVDYANERTILGCCKNSIQRKLPKGVWMHQWDKPIAKTLEALELAPGDERLPEENGLRDLGGLYVKGQFNLATQRGRDAYEDLKFGAVDEFSIGYYEVKTKLQKDGVLDLQEIDWVEWSPVLVGCNPLTVTLDIKQREGTDANDTETSAASDTETNNNTDNNNTETVDVANVTTPSGETTATADNNNPNPSGKAQSTAPQTKSQYLGAYAEGSATMAAINSLCNNLFYNVLYDLVYYNADEGETAEDQMAQMMAAFDEFRDLSLAIFKAIMGGTGDETTEQATKSLKTLWHNTAEVSPAGASYKQQLNAALAAVENCITRGAEVKALRVKDGRDLGEDRRAQVTRVQSALKELDALLTPRATVDPQQTAQARAKQLQRNQALRELTLAATPPTES